MNIKILAGALVVALVGGESVKAEVTGQAGGGGGSVPTVTIINKASEGFAAEEPNAISIIEEREAEGVLPARAIKPETTPELKVREDIVDVPDEVEDEATEAAALPAPPPSPTLHIDVDLTRQMMTVSGDGGVLHTWQISSGRQGYRTPTGTFKPTWMARSWFSRQYDNAPMPHSIFFHEGVAIHGSWATRALGRPASHGCVRLAPKNARTLFNLVSRHGKERTQIVVYGTPNFAAPAVASREGRRQGTQAARRANSYVYLPPSAASGRAGQAPQRARNRTAQQQYYGQRPPRGLFNGYGF